MEYMYMGIDFMGAENYTNVLNLLFKSVLSEGGDGDALWLTKYASLDDIYQFIELYNDEMKTNWTLIKHGKNVIIWGENQEWVTITDSREVFDSMPDYITLRLIY